MHSGQIGSNDRFGFQQIYRKRGCCYAPPELEISVDHYSNVLGPSGAGWGDDETLLPI